LKRKFEVVADPYVDKRWPESLFRHGLRSSPKIFECGSGSGSSNFSSLRIRLFFRLRL